MASGVRGLCRSCNAPVIWAVTEKGKPMPVDADPVAGGNIVLVDANDPREAPTAKYGKGGTHVSHFATCPNAATHRKAAS